MARIERRWTLPLASKIKSRRKLSLPDSILSNDLEAFDQKSNIEDFLNEIIYEIFDYLDGYDIDKAFSNLNIRFEDLILNYSFLMNNSSNPIKHHILSFHSSNELFLEKFISPCTIDSSFHRLESFIFDEISPFKLLIYVFYLESLPRLFSLSIRLNECYDDLGDIYRILLGFPILKYLKLKILNKQKVDITIPVASEEHFSPIEHLLIHFTCTLNELTDLLSYTPRITHLSCPNIVESDEILKTEVLMKLTNLVHLNVVIIDLHFENLEEFLLNSGSSLKSVNISIKSSDESYTDGGRWERRLISQNMRSLTKFIFSYRDENHDFETYPDHSLINRFTATFWIRRSWLLRIFILSNQIQYVIRPWSSEFEKDIDIPMIPNSSFNWLSAWSQLFLYKIKSLFQTIDITHFDAECHQIPANILINILNLLPNLDMIRLSDFPSYKDIYESDRDINAFNQFIKNNKITNLILGNISNSQQIDLIIHLFPRIKYLSLQYIRDPDIESIIRDTLLKIQEKNICHSMTLCIFGLEPEYDKVEELKQMIDWKNLLKNYAIHRRLNRFYIEWK